MGGLSVEADLQTIAAPGTQADIGEGLAVKAGAWLGDDGEVHVREIAVLDEGIGAQAVGALLVRDQRQLDLPGEGLVGGGEAGGRDHQRGAAGFHVQRAYTIESVAVQLAVGIAGPTAAQLYGVQMAVQADDRSGSAAIDNGDDIFSMEICDLGIVVFVQLCGQSCRHSQSLAKAMISSSWKYALLMAVSCCKSAVTSAFSIISMIAPFCCGAGNMRFLRTV